MEDVRPSEVNLEVQAAIRHILGQALEFGGSPGLLTTFRIPAHLAFI